MKKKNILLITADQWRGDCLSALGHACVQTPNIDALIADSLAFDHHYSVCAPCSPARSSLLTGMYLQNHRVTRNGTPLDDRHTNFARELRKAGYAPTIFGYTDTSLDPRVHSESDVLQYGYEGMLPGFDEGLLLPSEYPDKWLKWLSEKGYDFKNAEDAFTPDWLDIDLNDATTHKQRQRPAVKYKAEHSQTAFLTQHASDFIDQSSDAWCVHLSYFRPHPPFYAPAPYHEMYAPESVPMPIAAICNNKEDKWLSTARGALGDWPEPGMFEIAGSKDKDHKIRQIRAVYFGLVSKVDHYVGQLIEHLKAIDQYDNTLIIVTSDHGELLGDHGLFGKRGYFSESYHIPLIIRDPEQQNKTKGHIIHSFTESVDILPTILDWLGQPIPRQCDGDSLLAFIHESPPDDWRKEVHWEYDFRDTQSTHIEKALGVSMDDCQMNVIKNDKYMYVHFTNLPALFFDLQCDPNAANNVIDEPQYVHDVLNLSQRLLSWRMHNDERVLTGYTVSREGVFHR